MRITDIRAVQPETPGSPPDWRTDLGQIVVRVDTDLGLQGLGVGGGGAASIHVIHTVLRDLLLGQDARHVEPLHQLMLDHTAFYGRSGLVVMAISGIDLALWDVRGKQTACSVARLLNPQVQFDQPLPTYATVFDDAEAEQAISRGHSAIKLHVERFGKRPDPADIAGLVRQVRERLGADATIMIDAFARWNVDTTLRVAEAIHPYRVDWIEEPLSPADAQGYAALSTRSPVPIAGGEHEYTAAGFQQLIDGRWHAVLQPDINWCGGLTTMVEIYRMAAEAGLRVCPHRGSEAFALHAIAALDPQPLAESPRSWFRCLQGASQIEKGRIRLINRPGFGITVDPSLWNEELPRRRSARQHGP